MNFESFRIQLTCPLYSDHSGYLGPVLFEEGISVEPVHRIVAEQMSLSFSCVALNDSGKAVFEVLPGCIPASESMFQVQDSAFLNYSSQKEETFNEAQEGVSEEEISTDSPDDIESAQKYTREQLEAVADNKGLSGLREIGDLIGVKGKSIPDLIQKILSAQE